MRIDSNRIQEMLDWIKQFVFLTGHIKSSNSRIVHRGQVYWCNLGRNIGSEMEKNRPCVIVQNEAANKNSANVIVLPITHTGKNIPVVVPISTKLDVNGNVLLDGYANASSIRVVSKARLGDFIVKLSRSEMKKINIAISAAVGTDCISRELNAEIIKLKNNISILKHERDFARKTIEQLLDVAQVNTVEDLKNILSNKELTKVS